MSKGISSNLLQPAAVFRGAGRAGAVNRATGNGRSPQPPLLLRRRHPVPRVRGQEELHLGGDQQQQQSMVRRILASGHALQDRRILERLLTGLVGSGRMRLQVHSASTPLRSASLFGGWIRNCMIRNQETMTSQLLRRILGLGDAKSDLWSHVTPQEARRVQCEQVAEWLRDQIEALQVRVLYDPTLRPRLSEAQECLGRIGLILQFMAPVVRGSLHPDALLSGDMATLTPSEIAMLPSPVAPLRGVLIRLRGPRKGNKAVELRKSVGRVSINSVRWVVADQVSLQLPSKLGIFGLYIRFVYCRWDRLLRPTNPLPVIDLPGQKASTFQIHTFQ